MGIDTLFVVAALLLPIAALSGWLIGRREAATQAARREHSSQIATDYFMGLNYLLHDRPDKAIEVFVKVLEVETETVETHLALGNLFRRRGETDPQNPLAKGEQHGRNSGNGRNRGMRKRT